MVSSEAIARMRDAGLFRVMQPAIYGGYEYGFDALIRVTAPVAAGCGSSGWVFGLVACHQWLVATVSQARRRTNSGRTRTPSRPAPMRRSARRSRVDGGYRLSGTWSFTSGCDHAQWLFHGGMIAPASEGAPPKPALFVLPRSDVADRRQLVHHGARRHRQQEQRRNRRFVPAHRVVPVADLLAGTTPGAAVHANPLYRQSMLAAIPFTLVGADPRHGGRRARRFSRNGEGPHHARRGRRRQQSHGGVRHHPEPRRRSDRLDRSGAPD